MNRRLHTLLNTWTIGSDTEHARIELERAGIPIAGVRRLHLGNPDAPNFGSITIHKHTGATPHEHPINPTRTTDNGR